MPTYEYTPVEGERGCPACRAGFEVEQRMSDDPLERCPRCGAAIRRAIGAVNIGTEWREKTLLSDANLKRHGFKKLTNEGEGRFRVT
jgi:putative FmdB family regulatory protein